MFFLAQSIQASLFLLPELNGFVDGLRLNEKVFPEGGPSQYLGGKRPNQDREHCCLVDIMFENAAQTTPHVRQRTRSLCLNLLNGSIPLPLQIRRRAPEVVQLNLCLIPMYHEVGLRQ